MSGASPSGRPRGRGALARVLGFLRSRLLGAVTLPALMGAAWAWQTGQRSAFLPRLAAVLAGLAAVELLNLFGADYLRWARRESAARLLGAAPSDAPLPGSPVAARLLGAAPTDAQLPGSPVAARLRPQAIPRLLAGLAAAALGVLVFFAVSSGPGVLAFLLPAAAVGALYVFSPFPYAFLGTALVPPLVAGGAAFVLGGRAPPSVFLGALPVSLVSAGVILTYQVAYRRERPPGAWGRALAVLPWYLLADVAVAALLLAGVYPRSGFFALLPAILFPGWAARLLLGEPADPVPATAVGALLHASLCLAIAAGWFWG